VRREFLSLVHGLENVGDYVLFAKDENWNCVDCQLEHYIEWYKVSLALVLFPQHKSPLAHLVARWNTLVCLKPSPPNPAQFNQNSQKRDQAT
tara:strand:- start:253 stop:528 length:276 start_codon:yes stop_codon:yes gene_type:complete